MSDETGSRIIKGTRVWETGVPGSQVQAAVAEAARILRQGGLVAFPTETVYGLGANAFDAAAVKKIFAAKRRPPDNPLIVHIAHSSELTQIAASVPPMAQKLAERFWPGPLTIVLPRHDHVPAEVSCGLDTVAIRVPQHDLALALLKEAQLPLAAPSANISGRLSPTDAAHVIDDLAGEIAGVLDGGPCRVGVESTVVDLTAQNPVILRPGGVTREELAACLQTELEVAASSGEATEASPVNAAVARSPGTKYRHYAPAASLILVQGNDEAVVNYILKAAAECIRKGEKVGLLCTMESLSAISADEIIRAAANRVGNKAASAHIEVLGSVKNLSAAAENLYRSIRHLDSCGVRIILAEGLPAAGMGDVLMNRLEKAADEIVRV